ncbi:MAG: DNA replication/repair protein RecF [Bacteroidota bacterium]
MGVITRVKLKNFRNYEHADIELDPRLNIIIGNNGQGKTNFLEAVYYLSLLRSFRSNRINELRRWESDYFHVAGLLEDEKSNYTEWLKVTNSNRRRFKINDTIVNKASDFISRFLCVVCVPEDIRLLKGSPADRRRFADIVLSQSSKNYMKTLMQYMKALKSRNAMLKEPRRYSKKGIIAYDDIICQCGARILSERLNFVREFGSIFKSMAAALFPPEMTIDLGYSSTLPLNDNEEDNDTEKIAEIYKKSLDKRLEKDIEYGNTGCGVHRDDLIFKMYDKTIGVFGSEGQCRLSAIALKLGAVEYLKNNSADNKDICFLVDDVLGELDEGGTKRFFSVFSHLPQVILAATEKPGGIDFSNGKVLTVEKGHIDL